MIQLAFGSVPKDGGTFTFYRNMRAVLHSHGINMRCVSIGREQAALWEEAYVDEGCTLLAANTNSIKNQAQAFADWCETEAIDITMGINSEAILSSLPHLPERIRCMSRCANSFDHGYRITLSGYERLAGIIAQTPRQQKDLTQDYGANKDLITVIPNGIDPTPFAKIADGRKLKSKDGLSKPVEIGFLGRLEHNQKGVLFIPEILDELEQLSIDYKLTIAGKGKHRATLETQLATKIDQGRVKMIGALPPPEIPSFLEKTEIFLFPSQFEGCPNALLEAMMAGCAPVAWKLEGITDFIISEYGSKLLSPIGEAKQCAEQIANLANNPELLFKVQKSVCGEAHTHFTTEVAGKAYAQRICEVMAAPTPKWTPVPWSQFKPDPNFEHGWKDRIPTPIKNTVKKWLGKE